jgi:hypothetical protein
MVANATLMAEGVVYARPAARKMSDTWVRVVFQKYVLLLVVH